MLAKCTHCKCWEDGVVKGLCPRCRDNEPEPTPQNDGNELEFDNEDGN
jgi:hypothetical protein